MKKGWLGWLGCSKRKGACLISKLPAGERYKKGPVNGARGHPGRTLKNFAVWSVKTRIFFDFQFPICPISD
jgi:hypothetical protein